ncbi:MAG: hypothetical protein JO001_01400 [Alphaproteobacteria bacterium]|nr:hypothetical protein [Alphaproteobacteria bacterium]
MKRPSQERIAARFARRWKRRIRAEEGLEYRQFERQRRLAGDNRAWGVGLIIAAVALLMALWLR